MSDMTPSNPITAGQIGKINDLLAAALRKSVLQSSAIQEILEHQGPKLIKDLMKVIQEYADEQDDKEQGGEMVSRIVQVDRSLSPEEALRKTSRNLYGDDDVIAAMPRADKDEVEVFFFNLGRWVNDDDLKKEYKKRGLEVCDPFTLAKVNKDDPNFADKYPNATHWKDEQGNWCFAAFNGWRDDRFVRVHRDYDWRGHWWFAACRK